MEKTSWAGPQDTHSSRKATLGASSLADIASAGGAETADAVWTHHGVACVCTTHCHCSQGRTDEICTATTHRHDSAAHIIFFFSTHLPLQSQALYSTRSCRHYLRSPRGLAWQARPTLLIPTAPTRVEVQHPDPLIHLRLSPVHHLTPRQSYLIFRKRPDSKSCSGDNRTDILRQDPSPAITPPNPLPPPPLVQVNLSHLNSHPHLAPHRTTSRLPAQLSVLLLTLLDQVSGLRPRVCLHHHNTDHRFKELLLLHPRSPIILLPNISRIPSATRRS